MDWMLTDEDMRYEIDKAMREYAAKAPEVDWPVWRNRSIARAAARKVVEWIDSRLLVCHVQCPDCKQYIHDPEFCRLRESDRQALKQEVGL